MSKGVSLTNKKRIAAAALAVGTLCLLTPAAAQADEVHTRIISSTGKCLGIPGHNPSAGVGAIQWTCLPPSQGPDHIWTVAQKSGPGYWIENDQTGKCLAESAHTDGALVVQQECNINDGNQLWNVDALGGGIYHYRNGSGRCMAIQDANDADGAQVFAWQCGNNSGQRWGRAAP
jgi:hypothetical protein